MNSTDFQDRFFDFASGLNFREGLLLLDLFSQKPLYLKDAKKVYVYTTFLSGSDCSVFNKFLKLLCDFISDIGNADSYKIDSHNDIRDVAVHIFDDEIYTQISQMIPVYLSKFGHSL